MHSVLFVLINRRGLYFVDKSHPCLFLQGTINELSQKSVRSLLSRLLHPTCSGKIEGIGRMKSCCLPTSKRVLFACHVIVLIPAQEQILLDESLNAKFSWEMFSELVALGAVGSTKPLAESLEALKSVESGDSLLSVEILSNGNTVSTETDEKLYFSEDALSKERKLLKQNAGFGNLETKVLMEMFLKHSWPYRSMNLESFAAFMETCELTPSTRFSELFRAFDMDQDGLLSFTEFLLGLAALQPCTPHGKECGQIRTRYIFAHYCSQGVKGNMTQQEQKEMISDLIKAKNPRKLMCDSELEEEVSKILPYQKSFSADALAIKVGQMTLRGTSALFRMSQNLFPALSDQLKAITPCAKCSEEGTANVQALEEHIHSPSPKRLKIVEEETEDSPCSTSIRYSVSHHSLRFSLSGSVQQLESLNDLEDCLTQSAKVEMDLLPLTQPLDSSGLQSTGVIHFSSLTEIGADMYLYIDDANEMLRGLDFFLKSYTLSTPSEKKKKSFSWTRAVPKDGLAKCFISLTEAVKEILKNEPTCLQLESPAYILGDLHGNYKDLMTFEESLWKLGPGFCPANLLFLGDYVDRGEFSFEIIAYLFAQKVLAPKKVWLLRGNHELRNVQKSFSFERECCQKFGNFYGTRVWKRANDCFDLLPLSAVLDGEIFCVHGGIPHPTEFTGALIPAIDAIERPLSHPPCGGLAWSLLWNDPEWSDEPSADLDSEGFGKNLKRGNARVFSADALGSFLSTHGFSHVIRAHQVQQEGFQLRYKAQLLTVFSSSSYVGMDNGAACVMAEGRKLKVLRIERDSKLEKPVTPENEKKEKKLKKRKHNK